MTAEDPFADDRANFPEDALLLEALGRVVQQASYLDSLLRSVFCSLLASESAVMLTGGMMTGQLLDQCKTLLTGCRHLRAEEAREEGLSLLRRIHEASQLRNRLVHDPWGAGPGNTPTQLEQLRRSHKTREHPRTYAEVVMCAVELQDCCVVLLGWRTRAFTREVASIDIEMGFQDWLAQQAANNDE